MKSKQAISRRVMIKLKKCIAFITYNVLYICFILFTFSTVVLCYYIYIYNIIYKKNHLVIMRQQPHVFTEVYLRYYIYFESLINH